VSAEQANPIVEPPSQNLEGVSVQLPAPRDVGEPNRPYPSAVTHAAPPAPPKDFRTRLLEALSDKNLRYYAGPGFSEFIDKLAALAPLLPGSGTVQSMQDSAHAGKDFEAGDYGPAAAHLGAGVANLGLDWLPLGKQLAILGGMSAKTGRSSRSLKLWRRLESRLMKSGVRRASRVARTTSGASRSLIAAIG